MSEETKAASELDTEGFLHAEDMAFRLTASLSRLDEEANRYANAATHLGDAAAATEKLTESLREVAQDATRAIDTVASVGGPEIVAKLTSVESTIAALAETSAETLQKAKLAVTLSGLAAGLALIAAIVALVK